MALADEARNLAARQMSFATRRVTLPTELPGREELQTIIGMLATGQNPFGIFAWKLKRHREIVREFAINGQPVADKDDWRHVASYLAFEAEARRLQVQWAGIHRDLELGDGDAHDFGPFGGLAQFSELVGHACKLPEGTERLRQDLTVLIADEPQAKYLTARVQSLRELVAALDQQISSIRLRQTAADVSVASGKIPKDGTDLNVWATKFLQEHMPQKQYAIDKLLGTWKHLLERMAVVRGHRHRYTAIDQAAASLFEAGAPALARRLRTEPCDKTSGDPIPQDWREAWDWAVQFEYLASISAGTKLRQLTSIRSDVERAMRDDLGALVRERTFYALHGTMTGKARMALQAFASIIRRMGSGTGRRAAMRQGSAREAMRDCYATVPCWIMPCWRVSEQLPADFAAFDLVILDEASQSDVKELPALLRGKKVLIVGDDRQVSPTAAFVRLSDIERLRSNFLGDFKYTDNLLPGASVYDLAKVMFPDKFVMLKEHFRCVEPIIRFSMQFYNEPLLPLRVPTAAERLTPPLVDIFVEDGMRDPKRKINLREAEVIVEEIERIIADPSLMRISGTERRRSIGVISLIGSEQAHLIQKMLIERIGEVTYVDHNIVCGDSATLQGNERDIVFLSMITDNSRKSAQTAAQYEQRFNVAMSRARDRLVLVRSVTEAALNPADLKAKVIRHFRDPMPTRLSVNQELIELCQSSFEREIFNRLTQAGYAVTPQVGAKGFSIDMVVEGGNGRRLAIELDGDRFHGPERWADDMRRQRILERVGWVFWANRSARSATRRP